MSQGNAASVRSIEEMLTAAHADFDNSRSGIPGLPGGLTGAKMAHQGVMQSFPDRNVEILDVFGDGDRVFIRTRVTGTNQGGFQAFGVGPNGNPFDIESWSVYRFLDGKVVEHWGMNDALTLGMQLGAFPAPA